MWCLTQNPLRQPGHSAAETKGDMYPRVGVQWLSTLDQARDESGVGALGETKVPNVPDPDEAGCKWRGQASTDSPRNSPPPRNSVESVERTLHTMYSKAEV